MKLHFYCAIIIGLLLGPSSFSASVRLVGASEVAPRVSEDDVHSGGSCDAALTSAATVEKEEEEDQSNETYGNNADGVSPKIDGGTEEGDDGKDEDATGDDEEDDDEEDDDEDDDDDDDDDDDEGEEEKRLDEDENGEDGHDDENFEDEFLEGYAWEVNGWGRPQLVKEPDNADTINALEAIRKYMVEVVYSDPSISEAGKHQCRNYDTKCFIWALQGECHSGRDYMVQYCSPTCQTCDEYIKHDFDPDKWVDSLDDDQPAMQEETGEIRLTPWGVPQNMGTTVPMETLQELLDTTNKYMTESVFSSPKEYRHVLRDCENKHPDCTFWASQGLCLKERLYMQLFCAPACQSCDQLDFKTRCQREPDAKAAFDQPGELNAMFKRIVSNPQWSEKYGPIEILSSPDSTNGPWIITLENFLSDEECTKFIALGHEAGFERSEDVSTEEAFDGRMGSTQSSGRTSTGAWCYNDCYTDPILAPVHERVETLTGTPFNNSEYYQILRYELSQFYEEHHDYIHSEWDHPPGPRVITVFMYLNDVEEGGGTHFTHLNLTVMPKKGRAVIWPSVLDEDTEDWDERTMHEALPVTKGIKYGANAWIHLYDFKTAAENKCE